MRFNREDYGSRIRNLRKKRGLTQEQLAEKMNVSTPYIAKIENGKQTGPIELAVEFAEFFAVSLDYLLVGKGDFAEEQKRGLRMAISLLSELEASPRQQDYRQPLRSALGADGAGGVKQAKEKHRKYSCVSLWPVSEQGRFCRKGGGHEHPQKHRLLCHVCRYGYGNGYRNVSDGAVLPAGRFGL